MSTSPGPPYRFAHTAMGTVFEIWLAGEDEAYAGQAAQAVFSEVDRLETLFSRFNPASDIAQVNRLAAGRALRVGIETYECLKAAEIVRTETRGAFDVNVRGLTVSPMEKSSIRAKFKKRIYPNPIELVKEPAGFEVRHVRGTGKTVPAAVDLDLGGIGKGYALDRALAVLADWQIERVLLHGGTSTAVALGAAPGAEGEGRGWPVGVGGTWDFPGMPRRVVLSRRALSGSGTEVKKSHIIDPGTGKPAGGHLAAWASHESAAVADALSTAFMVMDTAQIARFCREHGEVWALVIRGDGTFRVFNRELLA